MNVREVLEALAKALPKQEIRELYICGGAALNLLNVSSRQTADIDVLEPKLDDTLKSAGKIVASKFGLSEKWLNNGPSSLVKDLESGWRERSLLAFSISGLRVFTLSRQELINSKLWAACDRMEDINDIVSLNPTKIELETAAKWVLPLDGSEFWPDIVEQCLEIIKEKLTNEHIKR